MTAWKTETTCYRVRSGQVLFNCPVCDDPHDLDDLKLARVPDRCPRCGATLSLVVRATHPDLADK